MADVTQANLGYDLEVMMENDKIIYIEVKSVKSFSDSFRITNNEYSSAYYYGNNFYLALAINGKPFQMRLIQNPINNLNFIKKCERWSWYCEDYHDVLKDVITQLSLNKR